MNRFKKAMRHTFWPHHKNQYKPLLIRIEGLAFSVVAILLVAGIANYSSTGQFQVLSYATNINIGDLLVETNTERVAAGLVPLTLNSDLNIAASNKAQHMIDNNYWAHVAPDGTSPWDFLNAVGYLYIKAGENLAYGFATSTGTVDGWMDSPGHRANILDKDFREVGFGIKNGSNYQDDENTVVVAMYTTPYTVPGVETVALSNPEENTDDPREQLVQDDEVSASEQAPQFSPPDELDVVGSGIRATEPVLEESLTGNVVTNFEALVTGKASMPMYATIGVLMAIGVVYGLRHIAAIKHYLVAGEHVLEGHPLLEAGIIYALIWLVLSASWGVVL